MGYDLGIVGAGPAGYTAALHASRLGKKVVLFERDKVGGVCLNRGCIPTKAIMKSAEILDEMKNSENLGISCGEVKVDFGRVIARKNQIVERLGKSLELSLKNSGVELVYSNATIVSDKVVEADGKRFDCEKIISGCGSSPRELKGLEFDCKFILSSDDILRLEDVPQSILIVGSGAIGTEWARILASFGTDVTVVELAENLLPVADIDVSKRVERIFKGKKIKFFKSTGVEKITDGKVTLTNGEIIEPECILVAAGRKPNCSEKIEGVCYIGDECGEIQLAHFASKQAIECVEGVKFDKTLVPSVVYGSPEIAWVGKREQDLGAGSYKKSTILVSALGKAQCDNAIDGMIKLLSIGDKIVGVHIVSKEASALIQQVLIAIQNDISIDKLKEICFSHPSYSEGIFESLFGF